MMRVTVWAHHDCDTCEEVIVELVAAGIGFRRVNLVHTPELSERLRLLGISAMPVIEAGEVMWVGHRPDLVTALSAAVARERE